MTRAVLLSLAACLLAACGAAMVQTRKRVKGPVPEVGWLDPGGGDVRYLATGGGWMEKRRREDAVGKIAEYCGGAGNFKIVDEVEKVEQEDPYNKDAIEDTIGSGGKHYEERRYHHVYFECKP